MTHTQVPGMIAAESLWWYNCQITEPTWGYAEIHGPVGGLLEVGTRLHPELTGRENIYLNGARLVRLVFAVATYLEPEIPLVDEVLAVGKHVCQTEQRSPIYETDSETVRG